MIFLLACQEPVVPGCVHDAECGRLEACIEGTCDAVECLLSEECPLASVCTDHTCVAGCGGDFDCDAGERCDGGSCVLAAECDNALEDCGLGEVCDAETLSCVVPSGDWCDDCSVTRPDPWCDGLCFHWEWEDPADAYCLPDCNPTRANPCPVGFICAEMVEGDFVCLANCLGLDGYL